MRRAAFSLTAHIGPFGIALLFLRRIKVGSAQNADSGRAQALAPNGILRAAILIQNPIYAIKDASSGELQRHRYRFLGRDMARRIGVPFEGRWFTHLLGHSFF